jgi:hypothetical protein
MARSSRPFEGETAFLKIAPFLFLLMAGLAGISCQDNGGGGKNQAATPTATSTPITGPGSSGDPEVLKANGLARFNYTAGFNDLTPIPCDERRQVRVRVAQTVPDCKGFNFTALNGEAQKLAKAQMDRIQCPKGAACSIRNSFYTYYKQQCLGTANYNAYVQLVGYVVCTTAGTKDSTTKGIEIPTDMILQPRDRGEPPEFTGDTGEAHAIDVEALGSPGNAPGMVLSCPSSYVVRVVYREPIPAGGTADYTGAIGRAQAQAETLFNLYSCEGNCKKKDSFAPAYVKWDSANGHVVVEVHFWVKCQKWL